MTKFALCCTILLGFTTTAGLAQTAHAAKTTAQSTTAAKPASASTGAKPTEAEVRKLFAAMDLKQTIERSVRGLMAAALDRQTRQAASNLPAMDDADRKFFLQLQQEELSKMVDPTYLDSVLALSVPAYRDHLSVEDVRQMTAFYSSPAGRHYEAALPEISKQQQEGFRASIENRGKQIIQDHQARLQSYIAKKQSAPAPAATPAPAEGAAAAPAATAPATPPATTPSAAVPATTPDAVTPPATTMPGTTPPATTTPGTTPPAITPPPK